MANRNSSNFVPDALRHFDSLPDSAHVRQPVVEALFSISAASVWRRVHSKVLPAPRKHGPRTTTWNVGELRAVLAQGGAL
jgi:predicted DNA-binding transcriptional regulator AlpA